MPLEIIRNDITRVAADAIVNTANPRVAVGRGVDSAIYKAAGEEQLLAERAKIGEMRPGEANATPAFGLKAKYIIHTVGPAWEGGDKGEIETAALCYRNSLRIAKDLGCESVAFPLISAGTYGFPKDQALKTAVSEISGFLFSNDMTVYLVVYDKEAFEVSGKAFMEVKSYIEEKDVVKPVWRTAERSVRTSEILPESGAAPRGSGGLSSARLFPQSSATKRRRPPFVRKDEPEISGMEADEIEASRIESRRPEVPRIMTKDERPKAPGSIDDAIKDREETFQQYLFRIIDRKGLSDPEVYHRANIDRKHFSKIRSNVDYSPKKKTVLALAIALDLNLDETKDLLLKAGMALTKSSIFDIIMEYCIENDIRNIYDINCILFKYDQPTLGA